MANSEILAGLSEERLEELNELADALRRAEGKSREARAWTAKKLGMSLSTFDRKVQKFKVQGVQGLTRKNRVDKGRARVADGKVVARIKTEYLSPYRPTVATIYKTISKDYALCGLKAPSYSFVRRVTEQIPPDLVARFRIGEKHFDDKFAYISFRKKPPRPRAWAQADHHPCDHQVVFPDGSIGRPWITTLYDLCTNEVLGFQLTREKPVGKGTYPGASAIGLALRAAVLRKDDPLWPSCGLFDNFHVDLGKDFRSQHVRAVCADLGIEIHYTRGYHGKSKGNVEGWFRIMEDGTRSLPGYCGNKPENNPERQRLKPQPLDPKNLLTIDEYETALRDWIVKEYHHTSSRALKGLSPIEALESHVKSGFTPREVRDERVLDLLLMRRKGAPSKVHNFGIQVFGRPFMAPELLDLVGRQVEVRWDPAKLGEIYIYTVDHNSRFVCVARNKELMEFGASEEMLSRERELKREQKRSVQERYQEMVKQAQYPNPLARAAAEQRYDRVLDEERQQLAAGAEPSRSTTVLLPKYAGAAKRLAGSKVQGSRVQRLREVKPEQSEIQNQKSKIESEPWEVEEELPTGEEIFRAEKNEWIEDEET